MRGRSLTKDAPFLADPERKNIFYDVEAVAALTGRFVLSTGGGTEGL